MHIEVDGMEKSVVRVALQNYARHLEMRGVELDREASDPLNARTFGPNHIRRLQDRAEGSREEAYRVTRVLAKLDGKPAPTGQQVTGDVPVAMAADDVQGAYRASVGADYITGLNVATKHDLEIVAKFL